MEFHKNAATLAVLVSACFVVCWGSALKYEDEDLPEINLPGLVLPNIDSLLDAGAPPKPCCLPKQWQGSVTSQSGWRAWRRRRGDVEDVDRKSRQGRSGFRQKTVNVYVDENSKKVAGRARCLNNETCGFVVVFSANTTADIYFFRMEAQKCLHRKFNNAVFHKQCLPDNSTFEGSVKIGPSASGLAVQVWRYQGKPNHRSSLHPQVYVSGRAVVTAACVPVVFQDHGCFSLRRGDSDINQAEMEQEVSEEDLYDDQDDSNPHPRPGRIGGVFMGSSYFTNVEPAVKDPSVFTPPSYCKAAPGGDLELDVDMEYPDIIDRFVVLK